MEGLIGMGLIGLAILAIGAGLCLVVATVFGAVVLFGYAAVHGFLGLVAYFAAWIFLAPLMLIASAVVGCVAYWRILVRRERQFGEAATTLAARPR